MGGGPNATMLEQMRQGVIADLQNVQRMLQFVDPNDPVRANIVAQQTELVAQLESLNAQLGLNPGLTTATPGMASPATAGSVAPSMTDRVPQPAPPSRANVAANPELARLQNAERQLRLMGQTAMADDFLRQMEQIQTQGIVEPQLPPNFSMSNLLPSPSMMSSAVVPSSMQQQAELTELRGTVASLRSEIAAMRDEMRALHTLLQQFNQGPGYQEPLVPPMPDVTNGLPDNTVQ
jgi:uncharacterized coiled-coil protein SlyX